MIDDLPSVSASRLRASGVITAEMDKVIISVGDVEVEVGLRLRKFRSGGSWSWFVCPTCSRWVRVLRLHEGCVVCRCCCLRRGLKYRAWSLSPYQRAERRIPKLRAMLESPAPLRLKPQLLWSKLERRKRVEAALRRCEFIVSRHEFRDLIGKDGG